MNKTKVLIDTSPLSNSNQIRGVGNYTRFLTNELETIPSLELERSTRKTSTGFKPDIIHYPFFDLFFPTLPLLKKAKTVVTIHDLIPLIFPEHHQPGKRGLLSWKRQQLALKSVSTIITDSQASKQDIVKLLKVDQDKVEVVYLAANPSIAPVSNNQIQKTRREFNLPKEYCLYVGDINYNKNLVQLIKSLKYLPERIHLVLVGKNFSERDIPEWQWIETQISLSDVASRVHFVNDLVGGETDKLSAIYAGAVCYIQPSLYEGFGLPVLEAMQAMTPVVCTNNSSLIEVGGKHAVFVGSQAQELADGVLQIIGWSDEKREQIINQANDWAQSFNWQKTAQETVKVYQKLIDYK